MRTPKLLLKVALDKLAKIEFLAVDEKGEKVEVRLTALDGETIEGVIESEQTIVWKGVHPFADADADLDLAAIQEILLQPEEKE